MRVQFYLRIMLGAVAAVGLGASPGFPAQTGDQIALGRFLSIGLANAEQKFVPLRGDQIAGSAQAFVAKTWPDHTNFYKCKTFISTKGNPVYECDSTERPSSTANSSDVIRLFNELVGDVGSSLPARWSKGPGEDNAGASAIYIQTWQCSNPESHLILDVEPVYKNAFGNGETEDPSKLHYSIKMWVKP